MSELDRGRSHAINKGFKRATSDIVAWLNSDDMYNPNVLAFVTKKSVELGINSFWLTLGIEYWNYEKDEKIVDYQKQIYNLDQWISGNANPNQKGTFWERKLIESVGYLR